MSREYKDVIAGWFIDPLTGKFCNDVYLECDLDEIRKYIEMTKLGNLVTLDSEPEPEAVLQAKKDLKAIGSLIYGIKLRSTVQPCNVGLFRVPKDWTREDVELTIRYLDEDKRREAVRRFKEVFGRTISIE